MNSFKEKEKSKPKSSKNKTINKKWARSFIDVLNGSIITRETVVKQLPFVFYMTFLAICYIANTYYAEKTEIEKANLKNELKELTSEFVSAKSEYMFRSKQSEVIKRVEGLGLSEAEVPPNKIVVNKKDLRQD